MAFCGVHAANVTSVYPEGKEKRTKRKEIPKDHKAYKQGWTNHSGKEESEQKLAPSSAQF